MRVINSHKINPANDLIELIVLDAPGQGNACHEYQVTLPNGTKTQLSFQNGPIKEVGVNGITQEVLLAVLIDRLEGFQSGIYKCIDNEHALNHLREAKVWLENRTLLRMDRGVEGTHTV